MALKSHTWWVTLYLMLYSLILKKGKNLEKQICIKNQENSQTQTLEKIKLKMDKNKLCALEFRKISNLIQITY